MWLFSFEFEDSLNKGKAPLRKEFIYIYIYRFIYYGEYKDEIKKSKSQLI